MGAGHTRLLGTLLLATSMLAPTGCGADVEPDRSFVRGDLERLVRGEADAPSGTALLLVNRLTLRAIAGGVEEDEALLRAARFVDGRQAAFEELPVDNSVSVAAESVILFEKPEGAARYFASLRHRFELDLADDPGRDEAIETVSLGDDTLALRDNGDPSEWFMWRVGNLVLVAGGDDREAIDPQALAHALDGRASGDR